MTRSHEVHPTEDLFELETRSLTGERIRLDAYRGKVLLIVNTASQCGFTPQLAGLQELYERYRDRGLVVLGFPCNQFAGQEPGDEKEIAETYASRGVTFPLFERIEVNGPGAHPLYKTLKELAPGILGSKAIKWNFTKFLVDRDGKVVRRFAPSETPDEIEKELVARLP